MMDNSFLEQIYDQVTEENEECSFSIDELPVSIERYVDLGQINKGGMKEIFSATDLYTDRTVALAILPSSVKDYAKQQSFIREAKLNAYLQHPGINRIYDIGRLQDGRPFFATKLLKGLDLGQVLNDEESSLTLDDLLDIFLKICEAVTYAHSHGVIHRDIKPENILIDEYNEVTLCDWGIAEISTAKGVGEDSIFDKDLKAIVKLKLPQSDDFLCGSPGYISPERYLNPNQAMPSMDIYSLGALLYKILTGKLPGDPGSNDFSESKALNLPAGLVAICQKALALDLESRYNSVDSMISDIRRYRRGYATVAENPSSLRLLKLLYLRNKLLSHSILLIFIIIVFSFIRIAESRNRAFDAKVKAEKAEEEISLLYTDLQEKEKQSRLQYSRLAYEWALNKINNGLYDKGLKHLEQALELNPDNHQARRISGLMKLASFRWSEAHAALESVPGSDREINFLKSISGHSKKSIMKTIEYCDGYTSRSIYKYSLVAGLSEDFDFATKLELYRKYVFHLNNLKKVNVKPLESELAVEVSSIRPYSLGDLYRMRPRKLILKAPIIKDLESLSACKELKELDMSGVLKIDFSKAGFAAMNLQNLILDKNHKAAFLAWSAKRKIPFKFSFK